MKKKIATQKSIYEKRSNICNELWNLDMFSFRVFADKNVWKVYKRCVLHFPNVVQYINTTKYMLLPFSYQPIMLEWRENIEHKT